MPSEFCCPRCSVPLRSEDAGVWLLPYNPAWDEYSYSMLRLECWRCSWSVQFKVAEVTEPERALP